jgi:hypothetical protein
VKNSRYFAAGVINVGFTPTRLLKPQNSEKTRGREVPASDQETLNG